MLKVFVKIEFYLEHAKAMQSSVTFSSVLFISGLLDRERFREILIKNSGDVTWSNSFLKNYLILIREIYKESSLRIHSKVTDEKTIITNRKKPNKKPNKFALFFAATLQKPEDREFIIDNIEERYAKDVKKHGVKWAKYMLWRDNLVGLWAAIGAKAIKGLKWVSFGYLIEKFLLK
ncbi:MAG TPA: hypothetical protein VF721_14345 [Pyrinomonadaceae bacterium]|jgi:hypothetical protein